MVMKPYKGGRDPRSKNQKKKKKTAPRAVDAFGDVEASPTGNGPLKNPQPRKSKKARRKARSPFGFIVAAAVAVGGLAVALFTSVQNKKQSDALLRSMRKKPLTITEHAACRMDCRFVSRKDVMESLFGGRVNRRKSELALKPCKKVVVDADVRTEGGRMKRVQTVFSACQDETRLITAIDASTNWPCGPC